MRKNSQLLLAYTALFTSVIGAFCYDTHIRSTQVPALSEAERKAADRRVNGGSATELSPSRSHPQNPRHNYRGAFTSSRKR